MPDSLLPFGEYRPDLSDYEGITAQVILNVVPRGDGYGPYPDLQAFTDPLPGVCRGSFSARKSDGSIVVFAATATNLYQLDNSTFGWTNVSKAGGPYPAVSGNANWQFAQFGSIVLATQANVPLQEFTMGSSTAFADNPGSPPQAAYITIVGQFVVLSGLLSTPYRMQWSAISDTTNWTAGVNQSDFQDFADGGLVRGVAGGEYGVIFQDTTIRQLTYAPGSSYIFQITRICEDQGLASPYAFTKAGGNIFFYSAQGFQQLTPGALPSPIGKEKIDRAFAAEWDAGNPQLFIATNDPNSTRVGFAFKSTSGSAALIDMILFYDYVLQRWSPMVGLALEYIATAAKPGVTLENLDQVATTTIAITDAVTSAGNIRLTVSTINLPAMPTPPDGAPVPTQLTAGMAIDIFGVLGTTEANGEGKIILAIHDPTHIDLTTPFVNAYSSGGFIAGPIDAMIPSLDSYPSATAQALSGFDSTNALGFFNGPNLEAKLESSEKGDLGTRIFVSGFRPATDAKTVYGSVSSRENLQATRLYSVEQIINAQGLVPARVSTRYSRGRIRIPYGTTWTFAMGVEPESRTDGTR